MKVFSCATRLRYNDVRLFTIFGDRIQQRWEIVLSSWLLDKGALHSIISRSRHERKMSLFQHVYKDTVAKPPGALATLLLLSGLVQLLQYTIATEL